MRTCLALALLTFAGCADPPPLANPEQVQRAANAMRNDVNAIVDELKPFEPLIDVYCTIHGEEDKTCGTLRTGWNAADSAIDAAHELIDAYEDVGVGVSKVEDAVRAVHAAARDLKAAVTEVVSHAVDSKSDGSGNGADQGSGGPQAAPGGEGAGQAPGADAPTATPATP